MKPIILLGASASGKDTVAEEIVKMEPYVIKASLTTRPKRSEKDRYHFMTEPEFRLMEGIGFLAETAEYGGYKYGSLKEGYKPGTIHILTPHGLRSIKKSMPDFDFLSVYLMIDRRTRLIRALQRGDDIETAYRRSLSDEGQFDGLEHEVDIAVQTYGRTPQEIANFILNFAHKEKHIFAVDIDWDIDEDIDADLPSRIMIPDEMVERGDIEEISDYITDQTGFCHLGFKLREEFE